MRVGRYQFRPSLWPTLVTLVLFPALLGLGFWQVDRGHQKQAQLQAFRERTHRAPVKLDPAALDGDNLGGLRYRPVTVDGRYDSAHQFLLDNRVQNGRVGYEVYTPLRLATGDAGVLVDRGFVPIAHSRRRLPALPAPAGPLRVRGLVNHPPRVYTLGDQTDTAPGWPKVLQRIDLKLQSRQLGYRLLPAVILLSPQERGGFARQWHPFTGFGPQRNFGYAFQWFMLAAVLAVIYLKVNTTRMNETDEQQD